MFQSAQKGNTEMASAKDVLKRVKDEEIEWIDLRFTDPKGKWQHLTMVSSVIGEDELLMVDEVTMDTSFNDDLELESIEFVALAEALTERYGEQVDFVGWIADLELDALVTMTVGELVTFVAASIDGPAES